MGKPIVSIIGPAIKTHYWGRFHNAFTRSATPWEIVFGGPAAPTEPLPENFRWLESSANPMTNMEMCARAAQGKYLLVMPDDVVVHHKSLDWCLFWLEKLPRYSNVGYRYFRDEIERSDQLVLVPKDPTSPVCCHIAMCSKQDWMEAGGIDRRFEWNWGAEDLHLRLTAMGGHTFISPDSVVWEYDNEPWRERKTHAHKSDRAFFESQWIDHSEFRVRYRRQPATPVQSFGDEIMEGVC